MKLLLFGPLSAPHTNNWAELLDTDNAISIEIITLHAGASAHNVKCFDLPIGKLRFLYAIPLMIWLRLCAGKPFEMMAHYLSSYGLVALIAGWRPVIVCWGSDVNVLATRFPIIAKRIAWLINRRAKALIAPTEAISEKLHHMGVDRRLIHIFQYGVDRKKLVSGFSIKSEDRAVGAVRFASIRNGRPLYQIEKICEAFLMSDAYSRGAELVVFGSEHPKSVAECARKHQQITIVHGLTGDSFYNELSKCDVAISIPVRDGLSLAVLEALGLGLTGILSSEGSYETAFSDLDIQYIESFATPAELAIEIDRVFNYLTSLSTTKWNDRSLSQHNFICSKFDSEQALQRTLDLLN